MTDHNALLPVESSDDDELVTNPVNAGWLAVLEQLNAKRFKVVARRYYLGLSHLRKQSRRSALPGQVQIQVKGQQQALQAMLAHMEEQKQGKGQEESARTNKIFVESGPTDQLELPEALRDFTVEPPSLQTLRQGPGRPPCDALCLMKAFLAAPLLAVDDNPTDVHLLLHSNPSFARQCGFLGRNVHRQPGEWTSRQLPSKAVCEEFNEVMTRYGLWQLVRLEQVQHNLNTGVVKIEDGIAADTTHIEANSHCDNVRPQNDNGPDETQKKHRKVNRMRKHCQCGRERWESCEHPWTPTDTGAAVVVKGRTRIYWAHKASVLSFADSEIPIDLRVCQYAAQHDGKTLVPHLEALAQVLPEVAEKLTYVLADDAYRDNDAEVARFGQQARLVVPIHPRKPDPALDGKFRGIDHFTASGVPVCMQGHRFQMLGRDLNEECYIWVAPEQEASAQPVCADCPLVKSCLRNKGRRHIRVPREMQPHIDWDAPQHLKRQRALYQQRTGVERAIKRLKVDLKAEHLTQRDALRVQAHLERKLLTLHLLLAAASTA